MTEGNPTVEEARQWAGEAIEELLRERRLGDEDIFVDLILAAVEPYYLDLIEAVRQEERERTKQLRLVAVEYRALTKRAATFDELRHAAMNLQLAASLYEDGEV